MQEDPLSIGESRSGSTLVESIPVLKNDLLGTIVTEFEVDSVSKIAKVLSIRWKLRPKPQN